MRLVIITTLCALACATCGTSTPTNHRTTNATVPPIDVAHADAAPPPVVDAGVSASADASAPPVAKASQELVNARALYNKNVLFAAHLALHKVVSRQTHDVAADVEAAELLIIKTTYRLKLFSSSLVYTQRVLQRHPPHPHHLEALTWLVKIARVIPHAAHHIPKRFNLNVNVTGLSGVRDELLLLMARRALEQAQFGFAISYARRVAKASPHYEPARLVHWEALWRSRKLTAAAKVLQSGFLKGSRFEARANLELARMFWRAKDFTRSRRHFQRAMATAKRGGAIFSTAMFERSLMKLHLRGKLSRLRSLAHADMRHLVYATYCALGPGPDAFFPYRGARGSVAATITAMLGPAVDNQALFVLAKAGFANVNDKIAAALLKLALHNASVRRAFVYQVELDKQLALIASADQAWRATSAATQVVQELTLQNALAKADAGRIVRGQLQRTLRVLGTVHKAVGTRGARIAVSDRAGRGFRTPKTGCPK